ncbi:MAG: Glutathione S-transferase-like protein [Myxococcaceae bacterium]|nr:Glutathione S-transferase-like protein [Myxococcaceae bacterium]
MSNVKLFSARACPYAHRTRLVLAEKQVPFELVEIDLQNKPSWFDSTISAYGKVPALQHGSVHLWESAVVNEYLNEVFPTPALLPLEPAARAVARIWIDYANTRFTSAFGTLLRAQEGSLQSSAARELRAVLTFLEEEGLAKLSGTGPFFLGSTPSLVDFAFYPWFERWPALAHYRGLALPTAHRRTAHWLSALAELPSVAAHHNAADYYIERYARHAAPTHAVA